MKDQYAEFGKQKIRKTSKAQKRLQLRNEMRRVITGGPKLICVLNPQRFSAPMTSQRQEHNGWKLV